MSVRLAGEGDSTHTLRMDIDSQELVQTFWRTFSIKMDCSATWRSTTAIISLRCLELQDSANPTISTKMLTLPIKLYVYYLFHYGKITKPNLYSFVL